MKFSIHTGSPYLNQDPTMTFGEITSKSELETIKLITENSDILINRLDENLNSPTDLEVASGSYDLTIHLPQGNIENLFKQAPYLDWKEMLITHFPELAKQFTHEETRIQIYSLQNHSLLEAQEFLTKFRATDTYTKLISTEFSKLSDEDIIFLTLTRKASDTDKIDIKILKKAILNIYLKNNHNSEAENEALLPLLENDFELFLIEVGGYLNFGKAKNSILSALESALLILLLINHSQKVFITKHEISNYLRYNCCSESYLNLSGLDLSSSNFQSANLNDVDLTDTNLANSNLGHSNLDRALLVRTDLSDAQLSGAYMRGTHFATANIDKVRFSLINFLTDAFDKTSLENQLTHLHQQNLDQDKHELFFNSITVNIDSSLRKMKSFDVKLIDAAINHVLFANKNTHTATNWFNFGVRRFSYGSDQDALTIPLSKIQKNLISKRNMLIARSKLDPKIIEDSLRFFSANSNASSEQKESINATDSIERFINTYGSCYQILEINENSSNTEIKMHCLKLSLSHYPEADKSPQAAERFQRILDAEEILTDENKRPIHDQIISLNASTSAHGIRN